MCSQVLEEINEFNKILSIEGEFMAKSRLRQLEDFKADLEIVFSLLEDDFKEANQTINGMMAVDQFNHLYKTLCSEIDREKNK